MLEINKLIPNLYFDIYLKTETAIFSNEINKTRPNFISDDSRDGVDYSLIDELFPCTHQHLDLMQIQATVVCSIKTCCGDHILKYRDGSNKWYSLEPFLLEAKQTLQLASTR